MAREITEDMATVVSKLEAAVRDLEEFDGGVRFFRELKASERAAVAAATGRLHGQAAWLKETVEALTGERRAEVNGKEVDPLTFALDGGAHPDGAGQTDHRLHASGIFENMIKRAVGEARRRANEPQRHALAESRRVSDEGATVEDSSHPGRAAASITIEILGEFEADLLEMKRLIEIEEAVERTVGPRSNPAIPKSQSEHDLQKLKRDLVRRAGRLRGIVDGVAGPPKLFTLGDGRVMGTIWDAALTGIYVASQTESLEALADRVGMVIGMIEANPSLVDSVETTTKDETPPLSKRKVFLVHGPSERRHEVLRLLEKGDLDVISLQEQVGRGRTIIEQLEHHSDVGYAVVLATGDDVGRRASDSPEKDQPRARQNVILELGWFMARLKRDRVVLLYEPGVELPSDYTAVIYISLAAGDWQRSLARDLQDAGMDVNFNKMLGLKQ